MVAVIFLFLTALFYLTIGILVIIEDKDRNLKKTFHVICILCFGWAITIFLLYLTDDPVLANYFRIASVPFWSLVYPAFLHFVIFLTDGRRFINTKFKEFMLYLPGLLSIVIYAFLYPPTPELNILTSEGWLFLNPTGKGIINDYYLIAFYVSYMIFGLFLLKNYNRKTALEREKRATDAVLMGIILTAVLSGFTDVVYPLISDKPLMRLGSMMMIPAVLSVYFSIVRYGFMDVNPQNILVKILQTIDEGLILIDSSNTITYANRGALSVSSKYTGIVGKKLSDVIDLPDFDIKDEFSNEELEIEGDNDELIPIFISKSTLRDEFDDVIGVVYVFRDITIIKEAHNELKQLNKELESRIDDRTAELKDLNQSLTEELNARKKMEHTIDRLAYYDSLTNLPNRIFLTNELNAMMYDKKSSYDNIALFYFDIDRFKLINESMGHSAGDEVLVEIATRLERVFTKDELIARMGADEYVVVVKNFQNIDEIESSIAKIKGVFAENFVTQGKSVGLTTSIGIALYPTDAKDAESLLKNADLAMHKAKEAEDSSHRFVSVEMKNEIAKDFKIRNELKEGLRKGELELYYQPQVNSETGYITGNEALIRWNHPEMGFLSPGLFLPVAEKYGLMSEIDDFVMNEAVRQNKEWQDKDMILAPVSINLSPKQFMNDSLVEKIKTVLEYHGLKPEYLELELTEGALLGDIKKTISVIKKLHEIGVRISIDDFGTEYSSLNYLKMLSADRLKIAKPFIDGIHKNTVDEAIIDAIVVLTRKIGIDLIAEGVEEHEQMVYLRGKGCTEIQGYYYYKPMSTRDIEEQEVFAINSYKR